MFLWVKNAPGGAEKIVPSETRESLMGHKLVKQKGRTEGSVTENDF